MARTAGRCFPTCSSCWRTGRWCVSRLTGVIAASDLETRNQSLDALCHGAGLEELLEECEALDRFRRSSDNLYQRVRALFFLYAIHRFHIPLRPQAGMRAPIPFPGYVNLLKRRFEEAIDIFLAAQTANGPSAAISSARAGGTPPSVIRSMSVFMAMSIEYKSAA